MFVHSPSKHWCSAYAGCSARRTSTYSRTIVSSRFIIMEGRLPCPVDTRGVPLVPDDFNVCYELCLKGIRDTNRHHLFYPRNEYKGLHERKARESGSMIVRACVCKHSSYHATYLPPKKPDQSTLCDIAQGELQPSVQEVFIRSKEQMNLENVC